ncbi:MAG: 30S ribosomal protein S6 [Patescibacteria group bacterium]|nr:30S ribosomal protein S6 [Patescibacteria group bacterium]
MDHYEILFIVPGAVSDEKAPETIDKVKKLFGDLGGQITKEENWGRKNLAYKIGQETQGTYVLMVFDIEPKQIEEINKRMRLSREILRHLIVKARIKTAEEIEQEKTVAAKIQAKKKDVVKKELAEAEKEEAEKVQPVPLKPIEEEKPVVKEQTKEEEKISMEDLDKKLDELLSDELE